MNKIIGDIGDRILGMGQPLMKKSEDLQIDKFKQIMGSAKVSFLFGAGVNGAAFPHLKDFDQTIAKLSELSCIDVASLDFEFELSKLDKKNRTEVAKIFCEEFNARLLEIDYNLPAIRNIISLFEEIYHVIYTAQNNEDARKIIDVFTLNYDPICENILHGLNYFCHVFSATNSKNESSKNVVARNIDERRYIPTFNVHKMHGSLNERQQLVPNNIILPTKDKLETALSEKFFRSLFNMKTQLSLENSVLFIIGYSGNDKHINQIIKDLAGNGLTVYWIQFDNNTPPVDLEEVVRVVRQGSRSGAVDSTFVLAEELKKLGVER